MGGAIARGLVEKGVFSAEEIVCTAKTQTTLTCIAKAIPGVNVTTDNASAVQGADCIFICVKPWLVKPLMEEIRGSIGENALLASVAAGVNFETLEQELGSSTQALFRVMPNTAIACGESMTFLAAKNATEAQTASMTEWLNALGETSLIAESQMAAATALASCGIAFAMRYISAACRGGVELGFYPDVARKTVLQTLRGAVAVLEKSEAHAEAEIDRVTTPGGVTIRGLNAMEDSGFTSAVIAGLKAAR